LYARLVGLLGFAGRDSRATVSFWFDFEADEEP
jgi:hypothetical protein